MCGKFSFRVRVTSLVFASVYKFTVFASGLLFNFRVCVTNLVPASVCQLWFPVRATSLCDKFSFSRLCYKFSFPVSVTSLVFASVYKLLFSPLCYKLSFLVSVSALVFWSV